MNNYFFYIAQILSILAIIIGFIGDAVKTKKEIYFYNGLSNGISGIKYFLLGGFTGAFSSIIATVRNIIFNRFEKKVPIYIIIIYMIIAVISQLWIINGWIDILPIFNICFFTICLSTNNEKIMKLGVIGTCIPGVVYDYYYKAYISLGYDVIAFFIGIITYYLYFIKKTK